MDFGQIFSMEAFSVSNNLSTAFFKSFRACHRNATFQAFGNTISKKQQSRLFRKFLVVICFLGLTIVADYKNSNHTFFSMFEMHVFRGPELRFLETNEVSFAVELFVACAAPVRKRPSSVKI